MNNLLLIIFFLIVCRVLPILRTDFLVIHLLQKKSYHFRRIRDFLQSPKGRTFFLNKSLIAYSVIFFLYYVSFAFFANQYFFALSRVLVGMLFLDSVYILYKFKTHRLILPQLTKRSLILSSLILGLQILIFLRGFFSQHFFVGMFVLLLCPYFVIIFSSLVLEPFIQYKQKQFFSKALQKIKKFPHIKNIAIVWSHGKSITKYLLSQIIKDQKEVIANGQNSQDIIGIEQTILNLFQESHKYFFVEAQSYGKGEISRIGQLLDHKDAFLTGIGDQKLSLFSSRNYLMQNLWEVVEPVTKNGGKLYIPEDCLSKLHAVPEISLLPPEYIVSYSIKNEKADAYLQINSIKHQKTHCTFHYKDQKIVLETDISPHHILLHLAGVLAFACDQSLDLQQISKTIAQFSYDEESCKFVRSNLG